MIWKKKHFTLTSVVFPGKTDPNLMIEISPKAVLRNGRESGRISFELNFNIKYIIYWPFKAVYACKKHVL